MFRKKSTTVEDRPSVEAASVNTVETLPPRAAEHMPSYIAVPGKPPMKVESPRRLHDLAGGGIGIRPPAARPTEEGSTNRRLLVGRDISLSGQISACDRLVVEGRIEAALRDARSIEIHDSGRFKGEAHVDNADIAGEFEGTLNVKDRLLVRPGGKVIGRVRYGRLEVGCGGVIIGDVQPESHAAPIATVAIEPVTEFPKETALPAKLRREAGQHQAG